MENSYVLQLSESKFKEFYLCFCGYSQCGAYHNYGPANRPNYIIHYILDGKGTYQTGDKKYFLSRGEGFLIEPETMTFYQADKDDPWSYLWIGFGGTKADSILRDLGLNSHQLTFRCDQGEKLKEIVFSMLKHTDSTTSNLYYLQGKLYEFFSVLAEDALTDACQQDTRESIYVHKAVEYIKNNYSRPITVTDIADFLNVNRSYLYTVFKNSLGLSPKDYLTRFRISRAKEQLILTDLPVEYIASANGYKNALIFTKAFKNEIGTSPSHYRRENRREVHQHLISNRDELDKISRNTPPTA